MTARGKCEAKRSTSPLGNRIEASVALKGRNNISAFQAFSSRLIATRGDAPRVAALAPGFHISRLWRSVSSFGQSPSGLRRFDLEKPVAPGFHILRLWRSVSSLGKALVD